MFYFFYFKKLVNFFYYWNELLDAACNIASSLTSIVHNR